MDPTPASPLPPVTLPASQPTQPISPPRKPTFLMIALVILIVLLSMGAAGFFAYQNYQLKNQPKQIQPTLTPTPTPDPTADWKTYTNEKLGFELKYPESYALLKEIPNITFGFGIGTEQPYPYLTISRDLTDYSVYKDCTANSTTSCLNGTKWNQSIGIMDTFLDGAPAKSIYFTKGVDGDYHIIQITNPIKLQLEMHIAGGKLDQTFTQILSTFKFLDKTSESGTTYDKTIVVFEVPLSNSEYSNERSVLEKEVVAPFIDFFNESNGVGYVVSLVLSINKEDNQKYPYQLQAIDKNGGQMHELLSDKDDGFWWIPTCEGKCPVSDTYRQKYPEIIKLAE